MNENHPLQQMDAVIEERGVVVIENVTRMPVYGEPYVSPHMIVCLNIRGYVQAEYDMQKVEFHPHDAAMVMPNHVLTAIRSSDDYLATLLVVSSDFLKWLKEQVTHITYFEFYDISSCHFTDSQFDSVMAYFKMLDAISKIDHPARKEMLASQMSVGTRMCDLFLTENRKSSPLHFSEKQKLLTRFYDAIVEHYQESREVKFYANLLCLTPKHFGTVIRQMTGVGAGEWIARYVVIQAKMLLRHSTDLSIQQIGNCLGFHDSSSFNRYFKANAGMTPKEYREQF